MSGNPQLDRTESFINDPRFTIYVGILTRPGLQECLTVLEHTHFPPDTPKNDDFKLAIVDWEDIRWAIVGIPSEMDATMASIADQSGLRITKGLPVVISGNGAARFPVPNERAFTLGNKRDHPVYRNDPEIDRQLREAERETVRRITGC